MSLIDDIKRKHAGVVGTSDVAMKSAPITGLVIDRDQRLVKGTMGTDAVDLEDEVILWGNMDTFYFPDQTRAMYYQHDYEQLPIATCRSLGKRGHNLYVSAFVSKTPFGDDLLTLIEEGAIRHLSGACAKTDAGTLTADERAVYPNAKSIVRQGFLIECSFTAQPCNPKAELDLVDSLIAKSRIRKSSAQAFGLLSTTTKSAPTPTFYLDPNTGFSFQLA